MILNDFQKIIEHKLFSEWTIIEVPIDESSLDDWPNEEYYIELGTLKSVPPLDNLQNYLLYVYPRKLIDTIFYLDDFGEFNSVLFIVGFGRQLLISQLNNNEGKYILKIGLTKELSNTEIKEIFLEPKGDIFENIRSDVESGHIINCVAYTNPSERTLSKWPEEKNIIQSIIIPNTTIGESFLNNIAEVIYPFLLSIDFLKTSLNFILVNIKFVSSSFNTLMLFKHNLTLCFKTILSLESITERYFAHVYNIPWKLPKTPIKIPEKTKDTGNFTETPSLEPNLEDIVIKPAISEAEIKPKESSSTPKTKTIKTKQEPVSDLPPSFISADKLAEFSSKLPEKTKIPTTKITPKTKPLGALDEKDIKDLQSEILHIKKILEKLIPIDFNQEIKKSLLDLKSITMRLTKLENELFELKKEIGNRTKEKTTSKEDNELLQKVIDKNAELGERIEILASRIEELLRDE